MAVTPGRASVTAQTIASSYETLFSASGPAGAGSGGPPIKGVTFHAAGETITVRTTRFGGLTSEMIVPADKDRTLYGLPSPFIKLEAKSASGTGTLCWEDIL